MDPTQLGINRALRGLRTGDVPTLATGAALLLFALYRRTARPKRKLIETRKLKPGQSLTIKASRQTS